MNKETLVDAVSPENPTKLKTVELGRVLDIYGIEKTWKSLIVTHIKENNRHFLESIAHSTEFQDGEVLNIDFLEDLTLGEASILYEFSLAHVSHTSRKSEGQYFTPDDVSAFLAEKASVFPEGKWLDPCSGIGNLSHWLAVQQEDPEDFIINRLHLLDRDPLALLIARALFAIHFEKTAVNMFSLIKNNFTVMNLLDDRPLPAHDFVIINPPYVAAPEDKRFESAQARDLYAYCLERVAKSSKGFISITPQSFTNSSKFAGFRQMLINKFDSFDIYSFDNMPAHIFKGIKFGSQNTNTTNSTRAGIIVAAPGQNTKHRITPLIRWKADERTIMLQKAPGLLTEFKPTKEMFPKLETGLSSLYDEMTKAGGSYKPLKEYLSSIPTEYSLIVPATPRYFISAVKRPLNRTSFKQLFFKTQEEADTAYLICNSSVLYWWWRVNDGGMTIASSTLYTLPVPDDLTISPELIARLEQSEQDNLVFKMNAGKANENVKHPMGLIHDLNKHIRAEYATALLDTHKNSHV